MGFLLSHLPTSPVPIHLYAPKIISFHHAEVLFPCEALAVPGNKLPLAKDIQVVGTELTASMEQ